MEDTKCTRVLLFYIVGTLGSDEMRLLTRTYPHKPLRKITVAISSHHADGTIYMCLFAWFDGWQTMRQSPQQNTLLPSYSSVWDLEQDCGSRNNYTLSRNTHYFPSDVGFTNIVVRSTRQVGVDWGWLHLVGDNEYRERVGSCMTPNNLTETRSNLTKHKSNSSNIFWYVFLWMLNAFVAVTEYK